MKRLLVLLAGALLGAVIALTTVAAHAQDLLPDKILSFADHLFETGDYYRAITEYERLIFFHPRHPLAKTAKYQIGMAYLKGEKYTQAVQRFRMLANEYPEDEIGRKALFMQAEAYYQSREYRKAIDVLERYLNTYPGDSRTDAVRMKMAWAYLRLGNWQEASAEFSRTPQDSPLAAQARALAEEAARYPDIPRKSPTLAGSLSAVLPGAGQLYGGRPTDAAAAFLLNGLFIWATVEAFQHDNNVTGGILLFFESGWYLGNVYNAVSSAHKYNRRAEQDFLNGLQDRYSVSLGLDPDRRMVFSLTYRF